MTSTRSYPARAFWQALGLNVVWMNISESVRWFFVVKPLVQADFAIVTNIAPDTPLIGALWTVWDLVLIVVATMLCWLILERNGPSWINALKAGSLVWLGVFVLLWLRVHNMGLATPRTLFAALPLAWFELVIAALLVAWRMHVAGPEAASGGQALVAYRHVPPAG